MKLFQSARARVHDVYNFTVLSMSRCPSVETIMLVDEYVKAIDVILSVIIYTEFKRQWNSCFIASMNPSQTLQRRVTVQLGPRLRHPLPLHMLSWKYGRSHEASKVSQYY